MAGVDVYVQYGASDWVAADATRLQQAMQRARFDLMGVASLRALAGDLSAGNAEVHTLLEASPQLRGWVVVNPAYPDLSQEQMRRYLGSSKWMGVLLNPQLCGQSLISNATKEVINAYRRFTKPLMVHVPDEPTVRELELIAAEFSTLKFIASGAGGDGWPSCILAAKRCTNIFLEPFTGGPHRGKIERILAVLGPHRLVFGSAYPENSPGAALGMLMEARISDAEKQTIVATAAIRLFGLTREG